jgi:hypothetical protein
LRKADSQNLHDTGVFFSAYAGEPATIHSREGEKVVGGPIEVEESVPEGTNDDFGAKKSSLGVFELKSLESLHELHDVRWVRGVRLVGAGIDQSHQ